jgi:hypothetical protein
VIAPARVARRSGHRAQVALARGVLAGLMVGCGARTVLEPASGAGQVGAPVWPRSAERAPAQPGVSVLAAPPPRALARLAVQAFFDAVRNESVGQLSAWVADDATISSGPGTTSESIAKVWGARFKQLDYGMVGTRRPYRVDAIGVFTRDEIGVLARGYQLSPGEDELLAVVDTRERERSAGPRHFGRRLEFLLSPAHGGYRIRRMFEDFQLP